MLPLHTVSLSMRLQQMNLVRTQFRSCGGKWWHGMNLKFQSYRANHPGEGKWQTTPVFLCGEFHEQRSLDTNSCPLNQWCHPTISSFVALFSFCPLSFPASGSFSVSTPWGYDIVEWERGQAPRYHKYESTWLCLNQPKASASYHWALRLLRNCLFHMIFP